MMTIVAAGWGWWLVLSAKHRKKVAEALTSPDIGADTVGRVIDDLVRRGAVRTLDAAEGNRRTGRSDIVSESLGFNYFCEPELIRPRPDVAPISKDGKPIKYVSPLRAAYPTGNRIYYPPLKPIDSPIGLAPLTVQGFKKYLIVTEGELKGLSLALHGFFAIAFAGVWNWLSKEHDDDESGQPIKDLDGLDLTDTLVLVIFDSDSKHNPMVMNAARRLMIDLEGRGAPRAVLVQLPRPSDEEADAYGLWQDDKHTKPPKFGADDLLHVRGRDALILEILESIRVDGERRAATAHLADVTADIQRRQIEKADRQAKLREEANNLIARARSAGNLEPISQGALALWNLKMEDALGYSQFKTDIKGAFPKLNLNDLERAVNENNPARKHLHLVTADVAGSPSKPRIVINAGDSGDLCDLETLVVQAWDSVIPNEKDGADHTVYRRGEVLVRMVADEHRAAELTVVTQDRLNGLLNRSARWSTASTVEGRTTFKNGRPPLDVVRDMLDRPDPRVPVLLDVSEGPRVLPSGRIVLTSGYCAEDRCLYDLSAMPAIAEVPSNPTEQDIVSARTQLLEELLGEFCFADTASRAHALAAILTLPIRPLIPTSETTPFLLFSAPIKGSGKSFLGRFPSIIATGRDPRSLSLPNDDAELRKAVMALMMKARPYLFFDNIANGRSVNLANLDRFITSPVLEDRILGVSDTVTCLNRSLWVGTGNNVVLDGDLDRRVVLCYLAPDNEAPWLKKGWRHPKIIAWCLENRSNLLRAVLVLIQAWISQGRPGPEKAVPPLANATMWRHVIGGILNVAGVPGFLENFEAQSTEGDGETQEFRAFIEKWHAEFNHQEVRVRALVNLASTNGLLPTVLGRAKASDESRDAVMTRALKANKNRVFGRLRLEEADKDSSTNSKRYRVAQVVDRGSLGSLRRPAQAEPQGTPGEPQAEPQGAKPASRVVLSEDPGVPGVKSSLLHELKHTPPQGGGHADADGPDVGQTPGTPGSLLDSASDKEPEFPGAHPESDREPQEPQADSVDLDEMEDSW